MVRLAVKRIAAGVLAALLCLAPIMAQAEDTVTATAEPTPIVQLIEPDVASPSPTPQPKTHKFFLARWDWLDWSNLGLFVLPSAFDSCQTSCKHGFLNGPAILQPNGTYFQPAEATAPSACVGKGQFGKNWLCGAGVIFGIKGYLIEKLIFGRVWTKKERNQDAALTTIAIPAYGLEAFSVNNPVLLQQYKCLPGQTFYNPFTGKCR